MFCSKCGTQNPDDFRFCRSCGGQLAPGKTAKPVAVDVMAAIHLVIGILICLSVVLFAALLVYSIAATEATLLHDGMLQPGENRIDSILTAAFLLILTVILVAINLTLAWGIWKGKRLMYTLTWIAAILGCVVLIGIPIGVAEIVMLSRPGVRRYFGLI